jgi:hypothetical protein
MERWTAAMDLKTTTLTSRIKLSNTFSLPEKELENNRNWLHVNRFAMRKDK